MSIWIFIGVLSLLCVLVRNLDEILEHFSENHPGGGYEIKDIPPEMIAEILRRPKK